MRAGQERDEMLLRRKGKNSKRAWIEKRERGRDLELTLISSSGFEFDSSSASMNAKEPRFGLEGDFLMNLIFFCFKCPCMICFARGVESNQRSTRQIDERMKP